jgi:hypothetical protein
VTITHNLAIRIFSSVVNQNSFTRKACYKAKIDGEGDYIRNILPEALELLPPATRGDADTKVSWDDLPPAVVKAMKHGPN